MKNYFDLPSGIVVQRSSISHMVEKDMTAMLNNLITAGKTVRVVESASEFFNDSNFFAAVDSGDLASLALIAEQRGIALSIPELSRIADNVKFKAELKARLDAQRPPYEFAELPEGWTSDMIRITAKGVYRAGHSDYKISGRWLRGAGPTWTRRSRSRTFVLRVTTARVWFVIRASRLVAKLSIATNWNSWPCSRAGRSPRSNSRLFLYCSMLRCIVTV